MHTTHGDVDGEREGGAAVAVAVAAYSFSAAWNPNSFAENGSQLTF